MRARLRQGALAGLAGGALLMGAGCQPEAEDACAESGVICTLAGLGGQLGFNGDGMLATETMLYFPSSLAFAPDGALIVDDFNNFRIRRLGEDGLLTTVAGNGVHGVATVGAKARETNLENPSAVGFLPDGRMLISEYHVGRVLVIQPDDTVGVYAGTGELGFAGDGGLAVDAELSEAFDLAVLPGGQVVIADTDNHCLRWVRADGVIETLAGDGEPGMEPQGAETRLFRPYGVGAFGGLVYVADTYNHRIVEMDPNTGVGRTVAGTGESGFAGDGGPATGAALNAPEGVSFDAEGRMLIADSANHRIRRVGLDGVIETVAGTGLPEFSGDEGLALDAGLNHPRTVLVREDGALLIADMINGAVRIVSP